MTKNRLRTCFSVVILSCVLTLLLPVLISAADHPILYLFWGEGCPHCEAEKEFLVQLQEKYPALEMRWFEIWKNSENRKLADAMRQAYDLKTTSVPLTFFDRWGNVGYQSGGITEKQIKDLLIACFRDGCINALEILGPRQATLNIEAQAEQQNPQGWELFPATAPPPKIAASPIPTPSQVDPSNRENPSQQTDTTLATTKSNSSNDQNIVSIPIPKFLRFLFGREIVSIDVAKIGLPLFTFIIAGLDGFNPCAMWVLSFLMTLVIYAKSRAKILLIGGIFVIASGGIYFMFMAAWLNIFLLAGYIQILTKIVAVVAIVVGLINCKDFFFFKKGISLTIPESAQPKLFKKMRELVQASALHAIILGTIVLAVSANLIELLCTAGFPMIYTKILLLQEFSGAQYYLYLVFYNAVYVIPLAAIVSVFAWKMGGRKLTEKEGRILKLIGGLLMLILGLVLLINPQILSF